MKERRLQLGLGISAAAKAADVDRATWTKWEKGTSKPFESNYVNIERALRWPARHVSGVMAGREVGPVAPPDDVEAMIDELGIDRRKWRTVDEAMRQDLVTAYRIARERKQAPAAAHRRLGARGA